MRTRHPRRLAETALGWRVHIFFSLRSLAGGEIGGASYLTGPCGAARRTRVDAGAGAGRRYLAARRLTGGGGQFLRDERARTKQPIVCAGSKDRRRGADSGACRKRHLDVCRALVLWPPQRGRHGECVRLPRYRKTCRRHGTGLGVSEQGVYLRTVVKTLPCAHEADGWGPELVSF